MIKKLQRKIILIITVLLSIAVGVIMLMINIMYQAQETQEIRQRLESVSASDGRSIAPITTIIDKGSDTFSFSFYLKISRTGQVMEVGHNGDTDLDVSVLAEYAQYAIDTGKEFGFYENYAFLVSEKVYGKMICFTDAGFAQKYNQTLALTTVFIGAGSIILFFGLAAALSFWLVKPVKSTFDKQKLFISNASHELKTPIAVISANADVLESEIGENKWLSYIKDDSRRMGELVNELLALARLDDRTDASGVKTGFSLSDAVLQTALPFESRMFEMGKEYEVDVQPDIEYIGDESQIKHIVSILIDNAVKYSDENGKIKISLSMRQNKRILEVFNTGQGIPADKLEKIFERFYREDEARSSSGGYGLGLSIAYEIVARHGGRIFARSEYGKWAMFTVVL